MVVAVWLSRYDRSSLFFMTPMDCSSPGSSVHGKNFPGQNTRVGCHFLLQGTFLTQRSNLCFLRWQADSLPAESPLAQLVKNPPAMQ